ncbi:MAG: hypothetical protein V4563_14105 [Pseudomonadota bacterium]
MNNGWTIETLKEHVTQLFASQKVATDLALTAADRAVSKAEIAAEKRFESVNEFRSTLADQQRTLIPRAEAELQFHAMREDIRLLKEANIKRAGESAGFHSGWIAVVGAIGLIGVVLGIVSFFKK